MLISCAEHRYYLASGQAEARTVARWLLFPMNVNLMIPEKTEDRAGDLQSLLTSHLEANESVVETLSRNEARELWTATFADLNSTRGLPPLNPIYRKMPMLSGSPRQHFVSREGGAVYIVSSHAPRALAQAESQPNLGKFRSVEAELVRRLAAELDFEVAVYPALQLRPAEVPMEESSIRATTSSEGSRLIWDGVLRRVEAVTERGTRVDRKGWWALSRVGLRGGLSLRVAAYRRDGELLFESYGGLECPYRVVFEDWTSGQLNTVTQGFRIEMRDDLLTDPSILQEGIALALYPYLVPE